MTGDCHTRRRGVSVRGRWRLTRQCQTEDEDRQSQAQDPDRQWQTMADNGRQWQALTDNTHNHTQSQAMTDIDKE